MAVSKPFLSNKAITIDPTMMGDHAEGDGDPTLAPNPISELQIRRTERFCDQIRSADDAGERLK